ESAVGGELHPLEPFESEGSLGPGAARADGWARTRGQGARPQQETGNGWLAPSGVLPTLAPGYGNGLKAAGKPVNVGPDPTRHALSLGGLHSMSARIKSAKYPWLNSQSVTW